ncbi:MAG: GNAT family N-acetyltransferase [Candidatus Limnocylindrales bacterium]
MLQVRGRPTGPGLDYGAVVRWHADDWADRLVTFDRDQRARGLWPSIQTAEGLTEPPELEEGLSAAGWSSVGVETVMWTRLPAIVPHLDPMLRLEAVTAKSLPEHEALERGIFGLPASSAPSRVAGIRTSLADGTMRAYLVRSHGEPVAVARLSLTPELGGLFGIGVAPERRRQGLGMLVTTIATRAALASGKKVVWLSVEDGNDGARILYEALGFRPAFRWRRWLAPPR